jgi:RNA polymerase sigma-70 factor (ECF subfamily)
LSVSGSQGEAAGPPPGGFEALFHQHADAVLAYAIRRSDVDAAEEVVAETFAVAWRRLDVVPDPALPWLLGVVRRVLANELRSLGRAEALTLRLANPSPHRMIRPTKSALECRRTRHSRRVGERTREEPGRSRGLLAIGQSMIAPGRLIGKRRSRRAYGA